MGYSSIKRKSCKEEGCTKMQQISCAGYCWAHCPEGIKSKFKSKRDLQIKKSNAAKSAATRLRGLQKEINGDNELELWFKNKVATSTKICENCGRNLNGLNDWEWRGCQHHIVEKSLCPSVASNSYNHGVLGYYCCHSQWHTSFLNSSKMPFMEIAKQRFNLFKHLIPADEMRKVNPFLKD
jgi:hypothetical protein